MSLSLKLEQCYGVLFNATLSGNSLIRSSIELSESDLNGEVIVLQGLNVILFALL